MQWKILKDTEAIEINGIIYELGDQVALKTFDKDIFCGKLTGISKDTICLTDRTDTKIYLSRSSIEDIANVPF